jgi:hypothetical protein
MSDTVGSAIAADKAIVEAATKGPWHIEEQSWNIPGSEEVDRILCGPTPEAGPPRDGIVEVFGIESGLLPHHANEAFLIAARSRWPLYIAAIEAVQAVLDHDYPTIPLSCWTPDQEAAVVIADASLRKAMKDDLRRALAVLAPNKEQQ